MNPNFSVQQKLPAATNMYRNLLCYQKQTSYFHKIVLLLVLTILVQLRQVESVTYNVSPLSSDGWCSAHNDFGSCFNLSEVAASVISNISVLNISLILAPRNHTLLSNLIIVGRTIFFMFSEESLKPAIINCEELS